MPALGSSLVVLTWPPSTNYYAGGQAQQLTWQLLMLLGDRSLGQIPSQARTFPLRMTGLG